MLGTRFEEYINFGGLPFTFASDIIRTCTSFSREANWHENLEIHLYTKGNGRVLLDENSKTVSENDTVVVNSDVIHHTGTDSEITYDCLIFDNDFCKKLDVDVTLLEFESRFKSQKMAELFDEIKAVYTDERNVCRKAKLYGIASEILVLLRENHTLTEKSAGRKNDDLEAVKKAIKYIRENYMRKIYLDDIAAVSFTDKYALSRLFKRITGQTPVQYINTYRCRKAAEYISDGKTVSEAAQECGFTNMSFFTKTFKTYMGRLPSDTHRCDGLL